MKNKEKQISWNSLAIAKVKPKYKNVIWRSDWKFIFSDKYDKDAFNDLQIISSGSTYINNRKNYIDNNKRALIGLKRENNEILSSIFN